MRVVETFGPTIQGEGPHAGRPCHFLRLGGCDFRCSWCDSPHAVEPELVRQAEDLTVPEVLSRLELLPPAPMLVISGGNPALYNLGGLVEALRSRYDVVAVETQGSRWKRWLERVDSLVVSPKPPSSGMATPRHMAEFMEFMHQSRGHSGLALKIVVFDYNDLTWALNVAERHLDAPLYLSVGTEVADELVDVAGRFRWLAEAVANEPRAHRAHVLPQLHVIAWGHAVGV
jgi:7-carboxy-7-deazaguanine synthase